MTLLLTPAWHPLYRGLVGAVVIVWTVAAVIAVFASSPPASKALPPASSIEAAAGDGEVG